MGVCVDPSLLRTEERVLSCFTILTSGSSNKQVHTGDHTKPLRGRFSLVHSKSMQMQFYLNILVDPASHGRLAQLVRAWC